MLKAHTHTFSVVSHYMLYIEHASLFLGVWLRGAYKSLIYICICTLGPMQFMDPQTLESSSSSYIYINTYIFIDMNSASDLPRPFISTSCIVLGCLWRSHLPIPYKGRGSAIGMCWASENFLSLKEGASSSWPNEEEESSY